MKILYAVQGTGNGHITRAIEIIPFLQKHGKVDILVSGTQADIELPFKVKHKFKGLSFIFGKQGGVDIWKTYRKLNSREFLKEIKSLDVKKYDLIISDFEPISCWASIKAKKICIELSNQAATLHPLAPDPKKIDPVGKLVLEHYAPVTFQYGFHFKSLDHNIFTPIIRAEVRNCEITDKGHYTVYLPCYDDERILKNLKKFDQIQWEVFSKHSNKSYKYHNISVKPIDKDAFLKSMASSKGVLTNAGFGTTSEALFLNKKLLVIPMKKQYEQHCNAAMLKSMGVPVAKKLSKKHLDKIKNWILNDTLTEVNYPDRTEEIINLMISNHTGKTTSDTDIESANHTMFQ